MSSKEHWEKVYATRAADRVGWYTPHLTTSMQWIAELGLDPAEPIIDVGAGASTLPDDLLDAGFEDITLLDISEQALALVHERLSNDAQHVTLLAGAVNDARLPTGKFKLWHDRALFHFLTQSDARENYKNQLCDALQDDGYLLIGVFNRQAPPQCSGLSVKRQSETELSSFFAPQLRLLRKRNETHITPTGLQQAYVYCLFQKST
ncbi:MAG: class I SAM-dependent methyltransferase [Gammaproteobacteria bacterium]|nr:class I SAM-dependent methyltransferase [Gammaproteobacteria bacterium]